MSKSFVLRAAFGVVALMIAMVALEGQANAFFKHLRRNGGGCGCAAEVEPSCGCAAVVEEPSCAAPEPSCGCPVVEESCGCPAEPSCGCSSGRGGRKFKLFGRFRNKGGCCESSCCAPVECGCGAPAEPACGAPAEAAPVDNATPPAPEAPAA